MTPQPTLSVYIAAHNRPDLIGPQAASLRAAGAESITIFNSGRGPWAEAISAACAAAGVIERPARPEFWGVDFRAWFDVLRQMWAYAGQQVPGPALFLESDVFALGQLDITWLGQRAIACTWYDAHRPPEQAMHWPNAVGVDFRAVNAGEISWAWEKVLKGELRRQCERRGIDVIDWPARRCTSGCAAAARMVMVGPNLLHADKAGKPLPTEKLKAKDGCLKETLGRTWETGDFLKAVSPAAAPALDRNLVAARLRTCRRCPEFRGASARVKGWPVYSVSCARCGCGGLSLRAGECPAARWQA